MVDCRSLIEFLRAFEQHRRRVSSSSPDPYSPRPRRSPLSSSTISRSRSSRGRLRAGRGRRARAPRVARRAAAGRRGAGRGDGHGGDVPPGGGAVRAAGRGRSGRGRRVLAWDAASHRAHGVEYDIQLETEECVRGLLPPLAHGVGGGGAAKATWPVAELGDEHRELEAVLRKMAPPNGRTVLIFRAPCGCPKERVEVWGAKKLRRMKK